MAEPVVTAAARQLFMAAPVYRLLACFAQAGALGLPVTAQGRFAAVVLRDPAVAATLADAAAVDPVPGPAVRDGLLLWILRQELRLMGLAQIRQGRFHLAQAAKTGLAAPNAAFFDGLNRRLFHTPALRAVRRYYGLDQDLPQRLARIRSRCAEGAVAETVAQAVLGAAGAQVRGVSCGLLRPLVWGGYLWAEAAPAGDPRTIRFHANPAWDPAALHDAGPVRPPR